MHLRVSLLFVVFACFGPSRAPAQGVDVPAVLPAEGSQVQQKIPPFAPALYTLRGTLSRGSSLVLLDAQGLETLIATDDRPAKAKGPFGGIAHATHFGPFCATPDLSKVIYTTFGKPKGSSGVPIGIGIGGIGVGVVLRDPFGTAELEGIHLWDRNTGKSERIWDAATLKGIGKTWRDTPEGKPFDGAKKLHKDLEVNSPKWIFHLADQRFLLVSYGTLVEIDVAAKRFHILYAYPGKVDDDFRRNAFHTWQEADGSVHAFRGDEHLVVTPSGVLSRESVWPGKWDVDEGKKYAHRFQPRQYLSSPKEGRFLLSDGENVALSFREETQAISSRAPLALEHDLLFPSRSEGFYAYRHFRLKPDELAFHGKDGSLRWTASLGDCRKGILFQENGEAAYVLVRRVGKGEDVPTRLTLNLVTGKVEESKDWTALPEAEAKAGAYVVPLDLEDVALVLPAKQRCLVWIPANGDSEPEAGRKAQWSPEGVNAGMEDLFKDAHYRMTYGHWCELTTDFKLLPRWGRPLADQILVFPKGRPTPLYNWVNQGITLGGPSTPFLFVGLGQGDSSARGFPGFTASVIGQYQGRFPLGLFEIPAPLHFRDVFEEWLSWFGTAAPQGQTVQTSTAQAAPATPTP